MKSSASIRPKDHPSYRLHRRQVWAQILLPVLLAALLFAAAVAGISLATFRDNGDVGRWAAISTIWLVVPVMVVGILFFAVLSALIYLISRLIGLIPPYSYQAQRIVYRVDGGVRRFAELARRPVQAAQELARLARAYLQQRQERS